MKDDLRQKGWVPWGLRQAWVHHGMAVLSALALAAGCAGYFLWPQNPWDWAGLVALGLALGVWALPFGWGQGVRQAVVFLLLGWVAAHMHVLWVQGHGVDWVALQKVHWVAGVVETVEQDEGGRRVRLGMGNLRVYNVRGWDWEEARVSVDATRAAGVRMGDKVVAQVTWGLPEGARAPGRADGRLAAWFGGWVPRGYVQGNFFDEEPARGGEAGGGVGAWLKAIDAWRAGVVARTKPLAGGVVAALLVGDQRAVDKGVWEDYRRSGLAHLLAISGMQLTLVGLGLWVALRRMLAFFPALALRVNVKGPAAVAAMGLVTLYMLACGAGVSVIRAWVMVMLVLLAALLGRERSGLRAWGLALGAVLAFAPWMVLKVGVWLSFGATLALLLWHAGRPARRVDLAPAWRDRLLDALAVTFVAGMATLPMIAWAFGSVNVVGLAANVVAVPMSVPATWMAFGVLALEPLGMAQLLLGPLGLWVEAMNAVARFFAALPWASVPVSPAAALGLGTMAWGACGLGIMGRWRWALPLAAGVMGGAVLGAAAHPVAELWVAKEGKLAGWVTEGEVRPLWGKVDDWAYAGGGRAVGAPLPALCDARGCAWATPAGVVLRAFGEVSGEDCGQVGLLVKTKDAEGMCAGKTVPFGAGWARWDGRDLAVGKDACARPWEICEPVW